jgi:hypothetical protein
MTSSFPADCEYYLHSYVTSEGVTIGVFWDVTPCGLVEI